jgi:hypothetical protein
VVSRGMLNGDRLCNLKEVFLKMRRKVKSMSTQELDLDSPGVILQEFYCGVLVQRRKYHESTFLVGLWTVHTCVPVRGRFRKGAAQYLLCGDDRAAPARG